MTLRPNVLVADDDPLSCRAVSMILSQLKSESPFDEFNIIERHNFDEMLFEIKKDFVDVIILDLSMPLAPDQKEGLHGIELIKAARQITHAGIIIYTGTSAEENEIKCLRSGADYFLNKSQGNHEKLKIYVDRLASQSFLRRNIIARRDKHDGRQFTFGPFTFVVGQNQMRYEGGEIIDIGNLEHDFFLMLFCAWDGEVKKSEYEQFVLSDQKSVNGKELADLVRRLRHKISRYTNEIQIESIRDVGYRINVGFEEIL